MGSKKTANSSFKSPRLSADNSEVSFSGPHAQHQQELEKLTLTTQPFRTFKFFVLAIIQYLKRLTLYFLVHRGWLVLLCTILVLVGILLINTNGPREKHLDELLQYLQFGLWWLALGVASSIGLGSGLHTFVLYLGPHIALFTIKATQCGRVDIKTAPYDTIQLKRSPSWLKKDCSAFGPPLFSSLHGSRVPLTSILLQVQLEAILWGVGTAIGELPPYFISRAASMSGDKLDAMEELNTSSTEKDGVIATHLNHIKRWLLLHSQYLNFGTILVLASVPNPLFDLAGIMCGQFGISFWKFFLATLIGKALIKTHLQTAFIIAVCNNQLLDWMENELIWVLSFIPGFESVVSKVIAKLNVVKDRYLATPAPSPGAPNMEVNKWDFSCPSIWNIVVWLMLLNFFVKIVNATAQSYLKNQQEMKLAALKNKSSGLSKKRKKKVF